MCVNKSTAPFHPSRHLSGSHLSPVFGGALRAFLKLMKSSLAQSIVSCTGCWGLDTETGEGERKQRYTTHAASQSGNHLWTQLTFPFWLHILWHQLATLPQPLIFQRWRLRVIFYMIVKEMSCFLLGKVIPKALARPAQASLPVWMIAFHWHYLFVL